MKRTKNILWGVVLIAAGVLWALKVFNVIGENLLFDGWWTLFLIVPAVIGIITERDKTGDLITLLIGTALLLCCQNVLSFSMLWKLIVPVIIVFLGLKLIVSGFFGNKTEKILKKLKDDGKKPSESCAVFSGCDLNYAGEVFEGAEFTAIFGGLKCDLREAVIETDCAIQATTVFGGIDLLVGENVNVKTNSNSIFGGMTNKTKVREGAPTLYVNGFCMFGGVEIK